MIKEFENTYYEPEKKENIQPIQQGFIEKGSKLTPKRDIESENFRTGQSGYRITKDGAAEFDRITIRGSNLGFQGWSQSCVFSVISSSVVGWAAGTFITADGDSYLISSANTGTMSDKTYIYFDINVSETEYQTTTSASSAVGSGKVLIAVAENGTNEATFTVLSGQGGQKIDANEIVANSITANQLSASLLYAGTLEIDTLGNIRSGQTAYNTGTGFWLGNDAGTPKFSIGSSTSVSYGTIAFDAVSNGGEDSNVSSSTHSHTCTGSDLVLLIAISARDSSSADRTVNSVTYNSVACTRIQVNDNSDVRRTEIWALSNPSTGANNVVVTMGGTCSTLTVCAVSLTGAGTIITSGGVSQGGSTTSASTTLTSLVDNSWLFGVLHTSNGGSSYVEGSGQTNRFSQAGTASDVQVSTKPITTAGSSSMSWTWTSGAFRAMSALVIQPVATITATGNRLTWDGSSLEIVGLTPTTVRTRTAPGGTFTVTIASPGVFSCTAHGFVANDTVVFSTTGALPTGLTTGTTYYIISTGLGADTFRVSATQGGSAINTSGTQSGTHTVKNQWLKPDGLQYVEVEVVGAGGGGGGADNATAGGGGGGGGGYAKERILAASLSATEAVTVGRGGTGGANTGGNGTAGGDSSFGSFLSATGGGLGNGDNTGGAAAGGSGGTGSGGDLNLSGSNGSSGFGLTGAGSSGKGGDSFYGFGGAAIIGSSAGSAGSLYGGGGGGAASNSASGNIGGDGAHGVVIITEYYS